MVLKERQQFQWNFPFFGLPPEYKAQIHEQIFQLTFNSRGSIPFEQAYNMPVYLRRWYIQRLDKAYTEENEAIEKSQRKSIKPNFPKIKK